MGTVQTRASSSLQTEADVVRTLQAGTYTIEQLYAEVLGRADISRDGGLGEAGPDHHTDRVWKRRVRGALQQLKRHGHAHRAGRAVWVVDRPAPVSARRMLLISLSGDLQDIELRLRAAVDLLGEIDEPVDLVLADPPYGLDRGGASDPTRRVYRRDRSQMVDGYQDVAAEVYGQFVAEWVQAAAEALRPGGQLAVICGPQRAAIHQMAAEHAGLQWVTTIAARRQFALYTTRRPAPAHWAITVMCAGPLTDHRRVFTCPPDLPKSRAGGDYPTDFWADCGRADRHGLVRYDNALPLTLVTRLVRMLTREGDLVVDPFGGSGTTAVACWETGRRCVASDVNPQALKFAAARLLDEHAWRQQNGSQAA